MIREIQIDNFKSIESLKLELGRFNVLIGANGCGKSNILEAITFGAAAPIVKLTNEFLTTRGIRMTEPSLMQSAFVEKNINGVIRLYFSNDKQETLTYGINWGNGEWEVSPFIDKIKSNVFNKSEFAVKALQIMQEKSISQLVVKDGMKVAGFIHLHDLLKEGIV